MSKIASAEIALCGDPQAGKTALIQKYMELVYGGSAVDCVAVKNESDMVRLTLALDGLTFTLNIVSVNFQQFHQIQDHMKLHCVALVYDASSTDALEDLDCWADAFDMLCHPGIPKILIANKTDMPRGVSLAATMEKVKALSFMFMELSAHTGENVDLLFTAVATHIIHNSGLGCFLRSDSAKQLNNMLDTHQIVNLNLHSMNLGDDCCRMVSELMKMSQTLAWLNLSYNGVTDEGATFIAEALKLNNSVTSLSLLGNKITDVGKEKLRVALEVNYTLVQLYVDGETPHQGSETQSENFGITAAQHLEENKGLGAFSKLDPNTTEEELLAKMKVLKHKVVIRNFRSAFPSVLGELMPCLKVLVLQYTSVDSVPSDVILLKNLEKLDLSHNQIKYISKELGTLTKLEYLDLTHNKIIRIPTTINQLQALKLFRVADNPFSNSDDPFFIVNTFNKGSFPFLCDFQFDPKNEVLNRVYLTYLADLPCLDLAFSETLHSLDPNVIKARTVYVSHVTTIDLSDNQLEQLPSFLLDLPSLKKVILQNNPLNKVPPPLRNGEDIGRLLHYIKQMNSMNSVSSSMVRVVLCGHTNAGKSSLIKRLRFPKKRKSELKKKVETNGVEFEELVLKVHSEGESPGVSPRSFHHNQLTLHHHLFHQQVMMLQLVDFADQDMATGLHDWCMEAPGVFLVLFDTTSFQESTIDYWMKFIHSHHPTTSNDATVVMLVGTHSDDKKMNQTILAQINNHLDARYHHVPVHFMSAISKKNSKAFRSTLLHFGQKFIGQTSLPVSYDKVTRFTLWLRTQYSVVTWSKFVSLAHSLNLDEDTLGFAMMLLHDLGVVVLDLQGDVVVLQNKALVDMFMSFSTSPIVKGGMLGAFSLSECWNGLLGVDLHQKTLKLMDKMGLVVINGDTVIVPALLPESVPDMNDWPDFKLADQVSVFQFGRRFTFNFIPSSFFAKLVKVITQNKAMEVVTMWRHGIILRHVNMTENLVIKFDHSSAALEITARKLHDKEDDADCLLYWMSTQIKALSSKVATVEVRKV